jgi:hypothetical protein
VVIDRNVENRHAGAVGVIFSVPERNVLKVHEHRKRKKIASNAPTGRFSLASAATL